MENTTTTPTAEPASAQPNLSELARQLSELLARDRAGSFGPALDDVPRPLPRKPRAPLLSPNVKAAITQSFGLWPLYVINAVLLWAVLFFFKESASFEYVERIARIMQLTSIALLLDIWLHPTQHPSTQNGPAQGARQYQRIYLIGIVVIGGCTAL